MGPNVAFFGKTGTLNSGILSRRRVEGATMRIPVGRDEVSPDPVVATTLVFAIGNVPKAGGAALSCGVVGTVYFRLNREVDRVDPLATAFANQRLWPVLRKHWSRLGVCPVVRQTRSPAARFTASR